MRRISLAVTVLILMLTMISACAPQEAATEEPSNTDHQPTPTHVPVDLTPAQRAAISALTARSNVSPNKIKLVSTEAVTWPNGCLGVVRIGVLCTQAQVEGFKIILEANGEQYEYHTNQDGSIVLLAEGAGMADTAEEQVIKQLAANLGLQESDISVVSNKEVEFADACLGVAMENVTCAQVVTPGHIIVLEANGIQYEYHTSTDGSLVQPATFALVWKREGGIAGFCDTLTVFLSGEVYSNQCKGQPEGKMGTLAGSLSAREQEQFSNWIADFGELHLDASDPKGVSDRMVVTLDFWGQGHQQPTAAEQRAMLAFAQQLYQKLAK